MVRAESQPPAAAVLAGQLQAHFVLEKPFFPRGIIKV